MLCSSYRERGTRKEIFHFLNFTLFYDDDDGSNICTGMSSIIAMYDLELWVLPNCTLPG